MKSIVIATTKSWNIKEARTFIKKHQKFYDVTLITNPKDLTLTRLNMLHPTFIFFPHWSWIIPKDIYETYPCIVFHMTDLPFGRGGSPLQNLISRGVYKTKISALKVDEGLDTGPIYLKKSISIKDGTAQDILANVSTIVFQEMIPRLLKKTINPTPQRGKAVVFKRRKSEESNLHATNIQSVREAYDFIRMLDGEGYPAACLDLNSKYKILFTKAQLKKGEVTGQFTITKKEL